MRKNQASVYYDQNKLVSVYVNLSEYEQMIFYWDLKTHRQKYPPKWRLTKQLMDIPASIVSYNDDGCVLMIEGNRAEFEWIHADLQDPAFYRGKLINAKDWIATIRTHRDSPTSRGIYTGITSGHYSEPQPYEPD